MNFTQSFEEFSKGLGTTDLVLYAGVALVCWILLKDRLGPLSGLLQPVLNNLKNMFATDSKTTTTKLSDQTHDHLFVVNKTPVVLTNTVPANVYVEKEDRFFKLIVSWKETRDLAAECGCSKAVEVADSMFPFLSPNVCGKDNSDVQN